MNIGGFQTFFPKKNFNFEKNLPPNEHQRKAMRRYLSHPHFAWAGIRTKISQIILLEK